MNAYNFSMASSKIIQPFNFIKTLFTKGGKLIGPHPCLTFHNTLQVPRVTIAQPLLLEYEDKYKVIDGNNDMYDIDCDTLVTSRHITRETHWCLPVRTKCSYHIFDDILSVLDSLYKHNLRVIDRTTYTDVPYIDEYGIHTKTHVSPWKDIDHNTYRFVMDNDTWLQVAIRHVEEPSIADNSIVTQSMCLDCDSMHRRPVPQRGPLALEL